jgi:hypothetical protein
VQLLRLTPELRKHLVVGMESEAAVAPLDALQRSLQLRSRGRFLKVYLHKLWICAATLFVSRRRATKLETILAVVAGDTKRRIVYLNTPLISVEIGGNLSQNLMPLPALERCQSLQGWFLNRR